ncbi:glycoside hydrolase [Dendryphion nanum]|uniref:Glycoside hydrolase n=1 Tax=Dendryphion nanum TaxID=256645 RepID=A0A9P9CX58_9PLEO|nr:glycoside hydrolase [Dendryphion nanum]
MVFTATTALLVLSSLTAVSLAHSHVDELWVDGVHYPGWNPNPQDPYTDNTPVWYTANVGGNPLLPIHLNQNDIICAKGGSNANISAPIAAGGTVRVRWWQPGEWPVSHHGPVLSYLASCNGPCSTVDPYSLQFVKIAEKGWINDSTYQEGYWAADELRDDDNSWNIVIPAGLQAGEYVLRHEIIALHVAHLGTGAYSPEGAEFYPQCISLNVQGDGTKVITGGQGAKTLYVGNEPGIQIGHLHDTSDHSDYIIPGPAVWAGALRKRFARIFKA